MHLHNAKHAVTVYLLETGKLPASLEDLEKPLPGSPGKYPECILKGTSKDPWKRPLVYEQNGPRKFLIRCFGADGKPGGQGADADLDSDHLKF